MDHDQTPAVPEPGPAGAAGSFDLGALLGQAQEMMRASAQAADVFVEGRAGGGAVTVSVNGRFEFRSVHIDPSVVDPADPALLEDLVLAALHDAVAQVGQRQNDVLGGLGLGGVGLDDLLGG